MAVRKLGAAILAAMAAVAPVAVATPAQAAGLTVIAHRGDMRAAPENTNAAFRSALAKGVNAIEMDVRFTKTHYPVVIHDATLDRTTNCSGAVSAKTRTQLARCDAGSWFSSKFRGENVPTLQSALRTIKSRSGSVKAILHISQDPVGDRAGRVRQAVDEAGMRGRIIVIADNNTILSRMRNAGFTELGRVFGTAAGWDMKWEYMVPYNVSLDYGAIADIHRRGGKVWPVESKPYRLDTLLDIAAFDGILVNNLNAL